MRVSKFFQNFLTFSFLVNVLKATAKLRRFYGVHRSWPYYHPAPTLVRLSEFEIEVGQATSLTVIQPLNQLTFITRVSK